MRSCKQFIITACLIGAFPLTLWAEAPVVDDSDRFAMNEGGPQVTTARPQYQEAQLDNAEFDAPGRDNFNTPEDGPALVREDEAPEISPDMKDNAKVIEKLLSLQQEVQELRGQLEVQAHDLKILQQQQTAFYKDLDTRLGSGSANTAANKPSLDMSMDAKTSPAAKAAPIKISQTTNPPPVIPVSKTNPADEQINYLAAYELVKGKRYDEALNSMQVFVQKYPHGGYTANAEYWLGELYMVKKNYPKAIEHFEVVLNKFSASSKSAASLLKVGYAFAASGNNAEAKKRLQQVIKNYPDTPTAQLASAKLEAINAL